MIFDNNLTNDQKPFLGSFYKGYIYDESSNKYFLHTLALFISKIILALHIYFILLFLLETFRCLLQ